MQRKGSSKEFTELAAGFLPEYRNLILRERDNPDFVYDYLRNVLREQSNSYEKVALLAWYHDYNRDKEFAAYLVTLLFSIRVIESQNERLAKLHGQEVVDSVMQNITFPRLGSDHPDYVPVTKQYLAALQAHLSPEECQKVLGASHHPIPSEMFAPEKEFYNNAPDLETYLKGAHQRLMAELQQNMESGKLWYEHLITRDVLDYVREHQEILTGIIDGDRLIIHTTPFKFHEWIQESDPAKKNLLVCHCPFVMASVGSSEPVSSLWCNCAGGFVKQPYDYIFGQELEVEVLTSALDGAENCTYAVMLPPSVLNKNGPLI